MSATILGSVGPSYPQNNLDAMVGVTQKQQKVNVSHPVKSGYEFHLVSCTFSKEKISIWELNWYWMLSMVFIRKQPQTSDAVEFKYAQMQNVKIISYLNLDTTELCWLNPSRY